MNGALIRAEAGTQGTCAWFHIAKSEVASQIGAIAWELLYYFCSIWESLRGAVSLTIHMDNGQRASV